MVDKIYDFMNGIYYLMKLNALWILFTLMGGVIFGFVPSTIALFACIRQRVRNHDDGKVFPQYWGFYKQNFRRSILMSIVFVGIALILLVETNWLHVLKDNFALELAIKLTRVLIVLGCTMFFPVFVHFNVHGFQSILQPALFIFICPLESILIIGIVLIVAFVFYFGPFMALFLGVSLPAYGIMTLMLRRFKKMQEKIPYIQESKGSN